MTTICDTLFIGGQLDPPKRKRGRPAKGQPTMSTTVVTPKGNPVTRTVFDLTAFDDVKLTKPFTPPSKPTTLEEALSAVGNDTQKLLDVIHEGLISEARDQAYNDITGFTVVTEDGSEGEAYTGKYADEEKGKLINGAVLSMAKMQSGGNWDSYTKEQKKAGKATATQFFRDNPAMLGSIQG